MYKFTKRLLVFLIPVMTLLALRYIVDPYDDYSWQIIPARIHNPRRDKVESYLSNDKYDYDSFVFGSSRSMRLNFGENSFNFGVFDARAEDIYCILRFILDHCTNPPKQVIVGFDPELLHNRASIIPDLVNEPLLSKYLIQGTSSWGNPTPSTLASIQVAIYHSLASIANYIIGGSYDVFIETIPGTGSFIDYYSRGYLDDVSPAHIELMKGRFRYFSALGDERIAYFDRFIELCINRNIRVFAFITPMHPLVIEGLDDQGIYQKRLADIQIYFDQIDYEDFSYVDFSLPDQFGGDDYDFFDILHVGDYNAELLVERLLELIKE